MKMFLGAGLVFISLISFQSQAAEIIEFDSGLSTRLLKFNLLNKVPGCEPGKLVSVSGELDCIFKVDETGVWPVWCDVRIADKQVRLRHLREDWDITKQLQKKFSPEPPFENDNPRIMKLDFKLAASEKQDDVRASVSSRDKRDITFACKSDDSPNRWAARLRINENLASVKVIEFQKEGGGMAIPKELSTDGSVKFSKLSGNILAVDLAWSGASLGIKQPVKNDPERFAGTFTINGETKDIECLVSKNY